MNKTRFTGLIVVAALILSVTAAFQAFNSTASAKINNSAYSGRADYLAYEAQLIAPDTGSQVRSLPDTGSGDLPPTGPNRANCFSAEYSAASDCDRLAPMQVSLPSTGKVAHGPTSQNCFSDAYHAGTDCDRLASSIK